MLVLRYNMSVPNFYERDYQSALFSTVNHILSGAS